VAVSFRERERGTIQAVLVHALSYEDDLDKFNETVFVPDPTTETD
jgi:hypothetical protein